MLRYISKCHVLLWRQLSVITSFPDVNYTFSKYLSSSRMAVDGTSSCL